MCVKVKPVQYSGDEKHIHKQTSRQRLLLQCSPSTTSGTTVAYTTSTPPLASTMAPDTSTFAQSNTWRIGGGEVRDVVETLIQTIWREVEGVGLPKSFQVMTYNEAMTRVSWLYINCRNHIVINAGFSLDQINPIPVLALRSANGVSYAQLAS